MGEAARGAPELVRRVARWVGEFAIIWLAAAATAASFLPRGVQLNAQDQLGLSSPSAWGSLLVAIPAAGLCAGIWWLLARDYYLPLAVAAAGLLVAALFLPGGLTIYFLPSPLLLLAVAWVLRWAPGGDEPSDEAARNRPPARRP
jgi:hypothetical protein